MRYEPCFHRYLSSKHSLIICHRFWIHIHCNVICYILLIHIHFYPAFFFLLDHSLPPPTLSHIFFLAPVKRICFHNYHYSFCRGQNGKTRAHTLNFQQNQIYVLAMWLHDDTIQANNSLDPIRCSGMHCLISSKAHNVSESRPPANCTQSRSYIRNLFISISESYFEIPILSLCNNWPLVL